MVYVCASAHEQLTAMMNLEILDLSKNQIAAFPDEPGQLASLKVLSLTHNRIYALPTYLTSFDNLKVFKVAHNPIEWPVSFSAQMLGTQAEPPLAPRGTRLLDRRRRRRRQGKWIRSS